MGRRRRRRKLSPESILIGCAALLALGFAARAWLEDRPYTFGDSETVLTARGPMRFEEEYLPGVVDCEIGGYQPPDAALEAQAIAARTYARRYLNERGPSTRLPIGPWFQCWRQPTHRRSRAAVERTAGKVLRHRGALIDANYAAGANRLDGACRAPTPKSFGYAHASWDALKKDYARGRRFGNYSWTQIFVTRNDGRAGNAVEQTALGPRRPGNRGALGQYAAICLAEQGWDTMRILRAFYGEDIELGPT